MKNFSMDLRHGSCDQAPLGFPLLQNRHLTRMVEIMLNDAVDHLVDRVMPADHLVL